MAPSPTSAAVAPSSRCARRSMLRRAREESAMHDVSRVNRRVFVISAAAFGGGLALGMDVVVRAADGAPEVTAWVVIKPDDSVVIRVARSEMGQGTMTGLAQL